MKSVKRPLQMESRIAEDTPDLKKKKRTEKKSEEGGELRENSPLFQRKKSL